MTPLARRLLVAVLAVVVIAGGVIGGLALTGSATQDTLVAYFPSTIGLYVGNAVDVMGVQVGTVKSLTVEGNQVKAVLAYNSSQRLPNNVHAVLMAPSLVSDRYIALTPVYSGGPALADGAVLSTARTAVPLEFDDIFKNLDQLDRALGPKGANAHGALTRLIAVSDKNLHGHGAELHQALANFTQAISTLSGSRGNLFGTVRHLQEFTTTLAHDNGGVLALNKNLDKVGAQLDGERQDLSAALSNLSSALRLVDTFVASNRNAITSDLHGATTVSKDLQAEKAAITQLVNDAPLAVSNLALAGDPKANTLDTKANLTYTGTPQLLCESLLGLLGGAGLGVGTGTVSQTCAKAPGLPPLPSPLSSANTTPASSDGLGALLGGIGK